MSNISDVSEGMPIPIPADFPVAWDDPNDAQFQWGREITHAPDAVLPLDQDHWQMVGASIAQAQQDQESPVQMQLKFFNNYLYVTGKPIVPADEMEARGKRADELKREATSQLAARWETEWLPEIRAFLDYCDAFDLSSASNQELLAHLDEIGKRFAQVWHIHFLIVFPCDAAMESFNELYKDLFEDVGTFDALTLLQGHEHITIKANHALWDVSRIALAEPQVRQALETLDPANVLNQLETIADASDFLAALRNYLAQYGQRGTFWGYTSAALLEDPTPVIRQLREYVTRPDVDPRAEFTAQVIKREQGLAEARQKLQGYPQTVVDKFESHLQMAQAGTIIATDHNYWIDFSSTYRVRRVLMACGQRLADAGVIDSADDIVYLHWDEIRESLTALPAGDRHALVEARQAEYAHWRTITPPSALGTINETPAPTEDEPGVLRGGPGSAGKVRGTARVLYSIDDAPKLREGDILVARTTAPPWTTFFASVAAIVTEAGGLLSHTAVIAREYGIPAVVGVSQATTVIKDGQMIEVDGEAGIVHLLTTE